MSHGGRRRKEPEAPEPTHAERARTLLHVARVGSLSTQSAKRPGFPFGSVMPYAPDEAGRPALLISAMAVHAQNLAKDPRASLLVAQVEPPGDPLGAARATLIGEARAVPDADLAGIRAAYLERHPNARHWAGYADFSWWRLEVLDVYYVGGFGVMGWVEASEYAAARPDPLAEESSSVIEKANGEPRSLVLLAQAAGRLKAQGARMTSVDRLGFRLRVETPEGPRGLRLAFPREVRSSCEALAALGEMSREAAA